MNDFTFADQDWIGLMIFINFADQDWIGFNFIESGLDSDCKISQSAHLWHLLGPPLPTRRKSVACERRSSVNSRALIT